MILKKRFNNVVKSSLRGFSLIEIILALGLLGVMVVCLIQVFIMGHIAIRQGSEVVTATNIAEEVMERSRMRDFDQIPPIVPTVGTSESYDGNKGDVALNGFPPKPYPSTKVSGVDYYVNVETIVPVFGNGYIKQIFVTVTWQSKEAFSYEKGGGGKKFGRSVTISNMVMQN